jgi:hypothetical protein
MSDEEVVKTDAAPLRRKSTAEIGEARASRANAAKSGIVVLDEELRTSCD